MLQGFLEFWNHPDLNWGGGGPLDLPIASLE